MAFRVAEHLAQGLSCDETTHWRDGMWFRGALRVASGKELGQRTPGGYFLGRLRDSDYSSSELSELPG